MSKSCQDQNHIYGGFARFYIQKRTVLVHCTRIALRSTEVAEEKQGFKKGQPKQLT